MGANVRLLTGLDLELERRGELVWLWPQGKRSMPPLKLRLIRVKGAAEADVYLLTNVLDTERLSDSTAVRCTGCAGAWRSSIAVTNRRWGNVSCGATRRARPAGSCTGG